MGQCCGKSKLPNATDLDPSLTEYVVDRNRQFKPQIFNYDNQPVKFYGPEGIAPPQIPRINKDQVKAAINSDIVADTKPIALNEDDMTAKRLPRSRQTTSGSLGSNNSSDGASNWVIDPLTITQSTDSTCSMTYTANSSRAERSKALSELQAAHGIINGKNVNQTGGKPGSDANQTKTTVRYNAGFGLVEATPPVRDEIKMILSNT